ncbi:acyltransferase 3 [Cylindrospermum sp. NIES-4074]|nr:acyltransferase 3 [Cylindrospermum sp. NIES-4074]
MFTGKNSRKKLNILQIFRGIAAILVLLVHGNALFKINLKQNFIFNIFTFGFAGVDFFFVLSGFIIFYIHQNDIGKKYRFKDFIFKRFLRVYPIYWVILIPRLLFAGKEINFLICLSSFTLFPYPSPPIVNVSWTLSYEIFFYLIFSLFILNGFKYLSPLIITWISLICIYWSLHSVNILTIPLDNILLQFIFSGHHLEFVFGCLAAYILNKYRVRQGTLILTLGIVLFLISAIFNVYLLKTIANPHSIDINISEHVVPMNRFPFFYYGIPSMLIIIGAVALDLNKEIRVPNILIYLGDASYSIYLVHASVINISTNLIAKMHLEQMFQSDISKIAILLIALIAGCIFHSYIEQPLLTTLRKNIFLSKNN